MSSEDTNPQILGFVGDLMSSSRIEVAALRLGFAVHWIEDALRFGAVEADSFSRQYAEHTQGPGAAIVEKISLLRPTMIVFDLSNSRIPWREWLPLIKSDPATRRIPVICFGSHVDVPTLTAAQQAGADAVYARSRFFMDIPGIILKHARITNPALILASCQVPLSTKAVRGMELFNLREFFEAHEILEEAWKEDDSPGRELYRAVLQVGVAYLQIQRRNYRGAVKMFLRLRQWINPLPDECRGVDVEKLRQDAEAAYQHLIELGEEQIGEFNQKFMQPVRYKKSEE